jgi:hypothetical protein
MPSCRGSDMVTIETKKPMPAEDEKFCELILYIAEQCQDDPNFGAVKLNKELFYSDFAAFQALGKSISGQPYMKLDHGPAPKYMMAILEGMRARGDIATQRRARFGHEQTRTVPLRPANRNMFTGAEIALVDEIVRTLRDHNATEVSELSHQFHGWKVARLKEEIPYTVSLVGTRKPTQAEREYGIALAGT